MASELDVGEDSVESRCWVTSEVMGSAEGVRDANRARRRRGQRRVEVLGDVRGDDGERGGHVRWHRSATSTSTASRRGAG
eukprot:2014057-Rhodomonas_salina.1